MIPATGTPRVRGWYYGWNIVAVCILSQVAANGLTYNSFSLFLPQWSAEMHSPISHFQLSVAAMVLGAALLAPIVGAFADKYDPRKLFAFGLTGMACFYLAISATRASWQIVALYAFLAPLPLCLATGVTANTVISRWFVRHLGLALGLSSFGVGMAGVVLPPVIAAILPGVGWRIIWRIAALVLVVIVMPLVVLILRDRPTEREGLHYLAGEPSRASHHHRASGGAQISWREIVRRKNFWFVIAAYVPMMALYGGCAQNIAPYVANHGLAQQSAGVLISVFSLAHLIATLALGPISDRFGNRVPFAALAAITAAGAVVLAFASGVTSIAIGCVLVGFAGGLHTLLGASMAAEFGSSAFGRAYGLSLLFIPFASLAPFAIARVQETTGSYTPALLGMMVIVLAGGAVSLLLDERRGARGAIGDAPPRVLEAH
jgi:MFS family permease